MNCIDDLHERVVMAYAYGYIGRKRMLLLQAILDTFVRQAFLPKEYLETERNKEQRGG